MQKISLIEPTIHLEKEYNLMLKEWHTTGEKLVPFVLSYDCSDFEKFIEQLKGFKKGIGVPDLWVPHSTFWLVNEYHTILGVSNIRHHLNDNLLIEGGHIGYGITPSQRKKGYATEILKLSLQKTKDLQIIKALVTCKKENVGSSKAIIKNGGIFWKEHVFDNEMHQNYWIEN